MLRSRPEIVGTFGVVASTHWQACAAGMAMLEKGGNAFDAAVATGCVLHIVEPDQNGPGGDVPIILWDERKQEVEVVCGQGVAPASISAQAMRDLGFDIMPGIGHLPAVVPGSFGAWMHLLLHHGSLTVRDVLEPAISIAREGFHLTLTVARVIDQTRRFMETHWPTSAQAYLANGNLEPGDLYTLPDQAATYERIIAEAEAAGDDREAQVEAARRAWYEGFVAEAIDSFMREPVMDSSGVAHTGFLTGDDLANWKVKSETPLSLDFGDYTVFKAQPWAQSPVFLQQLALLKGFDLNEAGPCSAELVHTVQECAKLAYADREAFYGDPDFVDVPMDVLLSDTYNDTRRARIDDRASHSLVPGEIEGYRNTVFLRDQGSTNVAHPEMTVGAERDDESEGIRRMIDSQAASHGDTCHFDIIDRWGNMISATPSGGWMTGSPAVPGLGFPVSVRGQMFWLDEQHPNCIAPGKRPRTTLTPTLAMHLGCPHMVFGTPGGDMQDQWSLQAFLRYAVFGMSLQESLDAPGFFTSHMPNSFYPREWNPGHLAIEEPFGPRVLQDLQDRGHRLEIYPTWGQYNSMTMATRNGRELHAASSPRRQCYAIGR